MKYHTIAIDCDDVIVGTASLTLNHYNKMYGTHLALKDMYSKDLKVWGVTDDATAIARVEAYQKTNEYQNALPFHEAIEATRRLSKQYKLYVVTGRPTFIETATKNLLERHFPEIFQSIEFTNFFGNKPRSKSDVCRELEADLLIDDHLGHAIPVAQCGIDVLLFGDYPWNYTPEKLPDNVRRVRGWPDVTKILLGN
jgi:uncharacterized HAD superfamily protein